MVEGGENFRNADRPVSMDESGTVAFLRDAGVQLLAAEQWKEGESILYIFPEEFREDNSVFDIGVLSTGKHRRPSIARLDAPKALRPSQDRDHFRIDNGESQVDYYVIDARTKQPHLVRSSTGKRFSYKVRREYLYQAADHLFPKGNLRDEH